MGPVSISVFSTLNSIYKRALCFDGVGAIYFMLFPNTKLPYTLWGPVSITKIPPPNSMYKSGMEACVYNLCTISNP